MLEMYDIIRVFLTQSVFVAPSASSEEINKIYYHIKNTKSFSTRYIYIYFLPNNGEKEMCIYV